MNLHATAAAPHSRMLEEAWGSQVINLVLIASMFPLAFTESAGTLRWIFPAFALLVGLVLLLKGRLGHYITFCVWLFVLTPALRRIVDLQVGWEPINTLLLAPYAAAGLSIVAFVSLMGGKAEFWPGRAAFLAVVCSATYGLLLAALNDRPLTGAYDYVRWIVPPCVALLIAANHGRLEEVRSELTACLMIALPVAGAYGIYQMFELPVWDQYWMLNANMQSIGEPEPLKLRIFGTMNSPGSLASFLLFGVTLLVASRSSLRWLGLPLGTAALALTMARTAWIGFACVTLVLALTAPLRTKTSVFLFASAAVLLTPLAIATPELRHTLEERIESLGRLELDDSYQDRALAYSRFLERIGNGVLGEGLAISGAPNSHLHRANLTYIDGGPIEVFTSLGLFGGIVYYLGVLTIAWRGLRAQSRRYLDRNFVAACKALVVAGLVLQISGTATVGEIGFFNWIAVGLALAAAVFAAPDERSVGVVR